MFGYAVSVMTHGVYNDSYSQIYSDRGAQLFQQTGLADAYDKVKMTPAEWEDAMQQQRDVKSQAQLRRTGSGSSLASASTGVGSMHGGSSPTCSVSASAALASANVLPLLDNQRSSGLGLLSAVGPRAPGNASAAPGVLAGSVCFVRRSSAA